ncbi:hypothetical protein BVG80_13125, partial [Sphingobacteriales bacterium TSM_CSM]
MKNTNYILFIIALSFYQTSLAQFVLQYKTCYTCPANNFQENLVSDDFGRRPTGSRWHKGLDFSPAAGDGDVGYELLALQTGTVVQLNTATSYKYITVQSPATPTQPAIIYGYGHIFTDIGSECGTFKFQNMQAPYDDTPAIIFKDNANGFIHAISTVNGHVLYNGSIHEVSNQVVAGQSIAPLGSSGGFAGAGHVHLYNFTIPNQQNPGGNTVLYNAGDYFFNFKNPLEFLNYAPAEYTLNITPTLTYVPAQYSSFRVRCSINGEPVPDPTPNRHDTAMDIDKVELFIKKTTELNDAYTLLKGTWLESLICNGGLANSNRYPSPGFPAHNTPAPVTDAPFPFGGVDMAHPDEDAPETGLGSVLRTGIHSYAYNTNPYDDYYFSDLKLRLHKDDDYSDTDIQYAYITEDARYPDNEYALYARLVTVTGEEYHSDFSAANPNTLVIDNFRPYIKEVLITQGGFPRYHAQWTWNAAYDNGAGNPPGRLEYTLVTPLTPATTVEPMEIHIMASEPMDEITFTIGNNATFHNALDYTENNTIAWFEVSPAFLEGLGTGDQILGIIGQDLTLNELTGFPFSSNPYTAVQLPHRTGASAWSVSFPQTTDVAHFFHIPPCVPGSGGGGMLASGEPCFLSAEIMPLTNCGTAFNPENQTLCTNTQLALYNVSCDACSDDVIWDFDGATAIFIEDPDNPYYLVSWSEPGDYIVSLTLSGELAYNQISVFEMPITVSETPDCIGGSTPPQVTATITPACITGSGGVAIQVSPVGDYSFTWVQNNQTVFEGQNLSDADEGTYTLLLLNNTSGCLSVHEFQIPLIAMQVAAVSEVCNPGSNSYSRTFSINSLEFNPLYWVTDNATGASQPDVYLTATTFTIEQLPHNYTITFLDNCGEYGSFSGTHNCCAIAEGSVQVFNFNCLQTPTHNYINIYLSFPPNSGLYTLPVYYMSTGAQLTDWYWNTDEGGPVTTGFGFGFFVPIEAANENFQLQVTNEDGCIFVYSFNCNGEWVEGNDIIPGPPNTQAAPAFSGNFPVSFSVCSGTELCIPYSVSDPDFPIAVAIDNNPAGFDIEERNIVQDAQSRSGILCFTPQAAQVGEQTISLIAIDGRENLPWYSYHHITVNVLCCPTGFNHPQELTAVYDC